MVSDTLLDDLFIFLYLTLGGIHILLYKYSYFNDTMNTHHGKWLVVCGPHFEQINLTFQLNYMHNNTYHYHLIITSSKCSPMHVYDSKCSSMHVYDSKCSSMHVYKYLHTVYLANFSHYTDTVFEMSYTCMYLVYKITQTCTYFFLYLSSCLYIACSGILTHL